jgi:hypothetical protein
MRYDEMAIVKYTATKLKASGKTGTLKPDENGYYTVVLGGLNMMNSSGEYYDADGARQLFDSSGVFQRRITDGNLKGELGHPKVPPGVKISDYMNRLMRVEETNVSHHISEVWLDENFGKNNPNTNNPKLVAILGKIKPSGPMGKYLKESLDNPGENVCFSIRAITRDYMLRGVNHRVLESILTWDTVVEPGLAGSNKFNSPACESFSLESSDNIVLSKLTLESIINDRSGITMESSKEFAREAIKVFNIPVKNKPPRFSEW